MTDGNAKPGLSISEHSDLEHDKYSENIYTEFHTFPRHSPLTPILESAFPNYSHTADFLQVQLQMALSNSIQEAIFGEKLSLNA